MALTEFYVDPSIGGDSGAGTKASPDSNLQRCFDARDHPSSGGSRINVKEGTDDVLTATYDLDTGGTGYLETNLATQTNPMIIQGYSVDENDHGIGGMDGDASFTIMTDGSQSNITFRDMHIHNVGNNEMMRLRDHIQFLNCELHGSTFASTSLDFGVGFVCIGSLFRSITNNFLIYANGFVYRNRFIDDLGSMGSSAAIIPDGAGGHIIENQIWLDSVGADGIRYDQRTYVLRNSIYQNKVGTGHGIRARQPAEGQFSALMNNLVEGFSGTGGVGIEDPDTSWTSTVAGNGCFDNTSDYGANTAINVARWDNESLSSSPFRDAANKDFSPRSIGNVKQGGQPTKIGLFTYPS